MHILKESEEEKFCDILQLSQLFDSLDEAERKRCKTILAKR